MSYERRADKIILRKLYVTTGRLSFICDTNILHVSYIVNVWDFTFIYLKRFQNEIKIMKYLIILDLLYFVVVMCCFGLVSGAGRNNKGDIYIINL